MRFLTNILAKAGLIVDGTTQLNTIANATIDTDKFLVSDSGVVKYRTGAQVLSDIGAANGFVPYTGATQSVNLGEHGVTSGFVGFDLTPTGTPTAQGTMYWDDSEETVALIMNGTTQHLGQDVFYRVKNSTGSTIPKGTAVRFAGTDGGSGHILIAPFLANGTYPSQYFMGVTAENITNGSFGKVMEFGKLDDINTSAYTDGAILYASTTVAGGFQTTAPQAPNNIIIVAAVLSAGNNGKLMVRPTIGSNINNDEGVIITSPVTNQGLFYDSGYWINKTIASALGYTPANAARQLTINGTTYDLTADRTWSVGTVTSIATTGPITGGTITGSGTIGITQSTTSSNGYLSSTDWNTFNNKQNALTLTTTGSSGASTLIGATLNIPTYSLSGLGGVPTSRQLTINGTAYDLSANRSWSVGTVTSVGVSVPTGLSVSNTPVTGSGTIAIAFAAGYSIPTTASQTNWDTAYNNRITSLTTTGTSGAATLVSNTLNIPQYQAQGNYITSLTGEATASGPGAASVTLTNSAVIGKVLTGLNVTGGTIAATDSILTAFGKVQNQINGLMGGVIYQGTWNASTNSPTLTSSSGTKGYYYIVTTAGSTNLDGITDWKIGDWVIYNGSTWNKVDNTDAVVSVNGQTGAVSLTTSNISEGTNLYYTDARARAAISLTTTGSSGAATYSSVTGVINIPQYTLSGLGGEPAIAAGTTSQYWRGDKSWQTLNTAAVAESGNLYFTEARVRATVLTGYTVGTNTALAATDSVLGAFQKVQGQLNAKEASITAGTTAQYWRGDKTFQTLNTTAVPEGTNLYYTDARSRAALSFTAGSGAYNSTTGVITIPTNTNQLTNGAGFLTAEADTLDTVLSRGTSSTRLISLTGALSSTGISIQSSTNASAGSVLRFSKTASTNQVYVTFESDQLYFGIPASNTTDADIGTKSGVNLLLKTANTNRISIGSTGIIKLLPLTSNGFLKTSGGDGTLTVDTNTYITGNQTITLSGDVTGSGATSISTTLANSGVTAGSYTAATITVDAKGRVTSASSNTLPTVNNGTLTMNVSGNGLSGSQTFTANQSTAATFTVTSNATNANTASTIVFRDASGNFSAGTITASLSGNASSATTSSQVTVNSGNYTAAWYPILWHSGNTIYSSGVELYAAGGYVRANYFNSSDNDETGITRFVIKNGDNYHRSATTTTAANIIRGVASGSWGIDITGEAKFLTNNASSPADANNIWRAGVYTYFNGTNVPSGDFGLISIPTWTSTNSASRYNLQIGSNIGGNVRFRMTDINGAGTWNTLLSNVNYNSYSPTLTGGGASGTWGINITGNAATATSADLIDGWTFVNTGSNSATAADSINSNGISYVGTNISLFGQSDGALYSQAYSSSWQHQIYGDYRTGQIAIRGKNSGTWQSWRTVLDSSNYTSYAPSLTGGGASGTWGINITGSAGSVEFNSITSKTGGTGTYQTSGDFRAPIFYDSADTSYYLDPNSESKLRKIWINNGGASGVAWSTGLNMGDSTNYWNLIQDAGVARQRNFGTGGYDWYNNTASIQLMVLSNTGNLTASSSMRAPIFYDSADTSYYLDPNSVSVLNDVRAYRFRNINGVTANDEFGLYFGASDGTAYAIYRESGSWTHPYPDLRIAFHTGIKIGANAGYNGVRFYDDYGMANQVMSVNNASDGLGANNVYVNNSLVAGSSLRAPIFYDSNDTTYYADFNNTGTSIYTAGTIRSAGMNMRGAESAGSFGGQIYPTVSYGGISLYGGNTFTNGAYFTVTGIDYGSSPGAGSAEFVIRTAATSKFAMYSYNGSTYTGRYSLWGSSGNVTIGSATTDYGYRLYVDGDIYATGSITSASDSKLKTNIREIENPLDRVLKSRGVIYDRIDGSDSNAIGFIAQEIEDQFPELVSMDSQGTKGVKYQNMVAVLLEAIKEQQKQINKLQSLINK